MKYTLKVKIERKANGKATVEEFCHEFGDADPMKNRCQAIDKLNNYKLCFDQAEEQGTETFHTIGEILHEKLDTWNTYNFFLQLEFDGKIQDVFGGIAMDPIAALEQLDDEKDVLQNTYDGCLKTQLVEYDGWAFEVIKEQFNILQELI